jgi:glycosyltransferase involved in cell wall biosynthesis
MTHTTPRFTVFTPCHNSARHVDRPFNSLRNQTVKDFEWLVIDDGSTDDTPSLLRDFARQADFPVRIITNETNKHLAYTCDLAAKEARGELFVRIDSDDEIYPEAIEEFRTLWDSLSNDKTAGIWCHVTDQHGKMLGRRFPDPIATANYFDYFFPYLMDAEKFHCHKTSILRQFPLDKYDIAFVHESFCWMEMSTRYDFIFLDKPLRKYFIEPENAQSLMKSPREKNATITKIMYRQWLNRYLRFPKNVPLYWKLRFHFAYAFYGLLDKEGFWPLIKNVKPMQSRFLVILMFPVARLLLQIMRVTAKG